MHCGEQVAMRAKQILIEDQEAEFPKSDRTPGAGPHRINKPLALRTDLYSRLFASTLHAEYIYEIANTNEKEDVLKDELHCQEHEFYDDECFNCKKEAGLLPEKG